MIVNKKNVLLEKEDLKGRNLPLLHQDESWIGLFGDLKNREIIEAREKLMKLLRETRNINTLNKKMKADKQKCVKEILSVSYELNKQHKAENVVVLDKLKEKLLQINKDIDEMDFRLETIPEEIRQANIDLLNATINTGYSQLKEREKKLNKTIDQLEKLLEKVRELKEIKETETVWLDETYTFMHRILGSNLIEKIDSEVF